MENNAKNHGFTYRIGIESARMMVYRAALMRDQGEKNTWHASIAKGNHTSFMTNKNWEFKIVSIRHMKKY